MLHFRRIVPALFLNLLVLTLSPAYVLASLIYTPNTFGLSARGIGLANALTGDDEDLALAYFNPAALSETRGLDFGGGYMYSIPRLSGGLVGGSRIEERRNNRIVFLGLKGNISELFVKEPSFRLGLGMNVACDNNFTKMMAFSDLRSADGEFYRYGYTNLVLQAALGVGITDWLSAGLGFHSGFRGKGRVITWADVSGGTSNEGTEMSGSLHPVPLGGLYLHHATWGIGATYREETYGSFESIDVTATPLIQGLKLPTMYIPMDFLDTFVPREVAAGVSWRVLPTLKLLADVTWEQWSRYAEIAKSVRFVGSHSTFETIDIWSPRVGAEYKPVENLDIRVGYQYEESPFLGIGTRFTTPGREDIIGKVILDNDAHVMCAGVGYTLPENETMIPDVTFDASYQYHYMVPRTAVSHDGYKFESEGGLHLLSASVKFWFH